MFDSLSAITSANIHPSPLLGLFGVLTTDHSLPSYFVEFLAFLTLLARRVILRHWKSPCPPSHTHWVKDALSFAKLEKIKYTIRGSDIKFEKIWHPFLEHVRSLHLDVVPID